MTTKTDKLRGYFADEGYEIRMDWNLVRTRRGKFVHFDENCRSAKKALNAVPWNWANGKTPREIINAITEHGYQICKTCWPDEDPI